MAENCGGNLSVSMTENSAEFNIKETVGDSSVVQLTTVGK